MEKRVITSPKAPKPGGHYSHAVEAGGYVFLSGQIGINPQTGRLGETVREQLDNCLSNIENVLCAMGLTLEAVVKTTVFLTNGDDFADVNQVYAARFPANPPARSTIVVADLPGKAGVEIEAVAVTAM